MTHCTMGDVLALAAGEGAAWGRPHVAGGGGVRAGAAAPGPGGARLEGRPGRRARVAPSQPQAPPVAPVSVGRGRVVLREQLMGVRVARAAWVGLWRPGGLFHRQGNWITAAAALAGSWVGPGAQGPPRPPRP